MKKPLRSTAPTKVKTQPVLRETPADREPPKAALRRQAEARADRAPAGHASMAPHEAQRALHELEVHQIELEMQNQELQRAQAELELLRDRYFDLYDLAPVGYCTLNLRGVIQEANLTAAKLLGLTRTTLIRQPISRFVHQEDREIFSQYRKKLFATAAPQIAELRLQRHDRTIFWANLEAIVIKVATGPPECRLMLSDITGRKQAEAYGELGREVLEILNGPGELRAACLEILTAIRALTGCEALGIRLRDGDDFPYYAQSGFTEEFLRTENTLVERGAEGGICRDRDGKAHLECTCGLVIAGRTDPANPLFTKGGSCWTNDSALLPEIPPGDDPRRNPRNRCLKHGYGSVALVPVRSSGRIVGLLQLNARPKGHFTLAGVERLEEIGLYIGEALLRRRVEEQLRVAAAELRRSNLDLEQFAYVASHDLQEPLRIISSFTQLLTNRHSAQLDDKAKEYLAFSTDAAQRMAQLVNDLLTYSRVGLKRGLVPVDLGAAVTAAVANLRIGLAETGAKLAIDPLPTLPVNLRELSQVFQNLIGNALKFQRSGVVPEIHIGAEKVSGAGVPGAADTGQESPGVNQEVWRFTVSDNGLGLDPRHAERIFTIFQRLHARQLYPGTGVGLAICKKIIERHGGRIWVESAPGQGAKFQFTLPA